MSLGCFTAARGEFGPDDGNPDAPQDQDRSDEMGAARRANTTMTPITEGPEIVRFEKAEGAVDMEVASMGMGAISGSGFRVLFKVAKHDWKDPRRMKGMPREP